MLHYPPLDLVTPGRDKPAARPNAIIRPWLAEILDTAYIPDRARRSDPLASPAWGTNGEKIRGIAPALVVTAEFDRLRSEGIAYARMLEAVGSLAQHHDVPGADHAYNLLGNSRETTEYVYNLIVSQVKRSLVV